MDPVTLALVGAAILAGVGIKRAAAPPPRPRPPQSQGAPEAPSLYGIPPHAFGGGLRPPVTHRAVTKTRTMESERGVVAPEEIKPVGIGAIVGSTRAQQAIASGEASDVVGSPTPQGPRLSYSGSPPLTLWPSNVPYSPPLTSWSAWHPSG